VEVVPGPVSALPTTSSKRLIAAAYERPSGISVPRSCGAVVRSGSTAIAGSELPAVSRAAPVSAASASRIGRKGMEVLL
jgi:hypothetical protein